MKGYSFGELWPDSCRCRHGNDNCDKCGTMAPCQVWDPHRNCASPCKLPTWPQHCAGHTDSVRFRIFDDCEPNRCGSFTPVCETVTIENPRDCREKVWVRLGIDECGNLVVLVKRDFR